MTVITQNILRYTPVVVMTLLVFVLSLLPSFCFKQTVVPFPPIPGLDKVIHALMYAALTATCMYALPRDRRGHLATVLRIALFMTLYGAAIEVCQKLFTISRSMELLDISANAAGALTSSLLIYTWLRCRPPATSAC